MKRMLTLALALLLSIGCIGFSAEASACEPAELQTQEMVAAVEPRSSGVKNFYSDIHSTALKRQSGGEMYLTIKNLSDTMCLYVSMYETDYVTSSELWSDKSEGGLQPGESRTYYLGSNVKLVTVRGFIGPGRYQYSY